jgi:hypothetical protein
MEVGYNNNNNNNNNNIDFRGCNIQVKYRTQEELKKYDSIHVILGIGKWFSILIQ